MTGTIINITTIIVGGTLGTLLGARLPDKMRETVMNGLGLLTLVIGAQMAFTSRNIFIAPLIVIALAALNLKLP